MSEMCLAEEWVRDGRGFYAVRKCEHHAKDRHGFGSWSYYAKPPYQIRAEAAEKEAERLKLALDAASAEMDAIRRDKDAAKKRMWELGKDCDMAVQQRDAAEAARDAAATTRCAQARQRRAPAQARREKGSHD